MHKELFKTNQSIYRVLEVNGFSVILIIDCVKKSMPFWVHPDFFDGAFKYEEADLLKELATELPDYESLTQLRKNVVRERYATISPVIPLIGDGGERSRMIALMAEKNKVSKATIRSRLCDYLAFMDLCALLPQDKNNKELTLDEKNFRWALNKFYFTSLKLSLKASYRRLLKERYCDSAGILFTKVPSFRQFQYFFHKTSKQQNIIISRNGKGDFMRNYRPLLGDGIKHFCPAAGYGMFDSTICDIFLVNEQGDLLGRPILAACVDAYSSLCLGYSLSFSGGIDSLRKLSWNIIEDKPKWCERFGIKIEENDWNCTGLPHVFITDRGSEYASEQFAQLADLGINIVNLPPYRPELKGRIEKFFDLIQTSFKKELAAKGVIFEDYQERGGTDYRKKATFTLDEFEKIVLLCIINYNSKRIIDLPPEAVGKAKPFANELWNWSLEANPNNVVYTGDEIIRVTLLPRTQGTFMRDGLHVHRLRYRNDDYTERFLKGGPVVVAYEPTNAGIVYLVEDGKHVPFQLIEKFFAGKTFEYVDEFSKTKLKSEREAKQVETQAAIDLTREIERIAATKPKAKIETRHVRRHRKTEIKKEGQR